ncbi:MAG: thiamine-phosphate kinase, partial [Planctomycetota bacterium]|nr:thiamine-phosphate kinase [Planctomycetota bacterium]
MQEEELLSRMRQLFAAAGPSVLIGSGPDDCAHLEADGRRLAVSCDAFAEGSHFLPDAPPEAVAEKSLAASVSDLAASACRPRWALVSLAIRQGADPDWANRFAQGLARSAGELGVPIVGGDTVSSRHGMFVSVTVIGEPLPGGPVLRSGAKPGDALVVTGEFGGSLSGRHLHPRPRLREIGELMGFCAGSGLGRLPGAAIDVSDGLALDLSRLCRESGVGVELEAAAIPVAAEAGPAAESSCRSRLDCALADGEDFELLLALPLELWAAFKRRLEETAETRRQAGLAGFARIGTFRERDAGRCLRWP